MRRFLDLLYAASGGAAALCILAICALVMTQVVLNLVDKTAAAVTGSAIGLTVPSYADFTGFFLAAASFLALAYTLRHGGHIRVVLVLDRLPGRLQRAAEFWCVGLAAAIACYFTWYTAGLVHESWSYNDLSAGMVAVPLWIPQSAVLVGLAILAIALVDEFVGLLRGRRPSYAGKGENLLGELTAKADDEAGAAEGGRDV